MICHTGSFDKMDFSLLKGQYMKYPKGVDTSVALITVILTVTPTDDRTSQAPGPQVGGPGTDSRASLCGSSHHPYNVGVGLSPGSRSTWLNYAKGFLTRSAGRSLPVVGELEPWSPDCRVKGFSGREHTRTGNSIARGPTSPLT